MMLTEGLLYNAITLLHVNKIGGDMKKDLNGLLVEKNMPNVDKLLSMNVADFVQLNTAEVMGTEQVGFGKEFVQEIVLASELIERLRTKGSILAKAKIKTMTSKILDIPVRGGRVRMSLTTELIDAPTGGASNPTQIKKISTPKITLTAKEMKITVYYSDTFLDDSVVAVAEYVLNAIADSYDTSIHEVLLNGDTDTGANTNINIIDGNTSALSDGNKTDFLLADGARKIAITKGATVGAGGNLAIENIRSARAKMGVKGLNPDDLVLVPDIQTYFYLMNLTEVETMEKFGESATIKNGTLVAIDGISIEMREEMLKATATGEISATAGNNIKGQMSVIHTPSVNVGIRKGLSTELSRYAEDGITGVTGTARVGVTFDDTQNNILPTSPCALIINI